MGERVSSGPVAMMLLVVLAGCSGPSGKGTEDLRRAPEEVWDGGDGGAEIVERVASDVATSEVVTDVEVVGTEVVAAGCLPGIPDRPLDMAADETFEVGPYVLDARPDGMTVAWRTVEESVGTVHFGEGEPSGASVSEATATRYHQVRLTGLNPSVRYAYQVECGGKVSAVHHFYTAPPPGQPARFVAWGDNQYGPELFAPLLEDMAESAPHAAFGLGDHVNDGQEEWRWLEELFGPGRAFFHEVPFYPAMGNHEGNASFWYDFFAFDDDKVPEDVYNESYYSFTYGNVFILVVNTNTVFFPIGEVDTPVSAWVREQVTSPAAQAATWRIAYGHEPGISESWSAGDCGYDGYLPVRNWLQPFLAENGFHLYLCGHTHAYERALLDTGMLQIISGGGGGDMDEWCKDFPETTVVYQNHHFLRIDADCQRLRVEAVDIDGTLFDWVELDADQPGVLVDQGPMDDLPELIVSADSPTR
jgi:hypothetical protein